MHRLRDVRRVHTIVIWNVQVVGLQGQQIVDQFSRGNVEDLQKVALLCLGGRIN